MAVLRRSTKTKTITTLEDRRDAAEEAEAEVEDAETLTRATTSNCRRDAKPALHPGKPTTTTTTTISNSRREEEEEEEEEEERVNRITTIWIWMTITLRRRDESIPAAAAPEAEAESAAAGSSPAPEIPTTISRRRLLLCHDAGKRAIIGKAASR